MARRYPINSAKNGSNRTASLPAREKCRPDGSVQKGRYFHQEDRVFGIEGWHRRGTEVEFMVYSCPQSADLREHKDMENHFTAVFEQDGSWWIGYVEELPGANTQGATLEEARENLKDAVALILESNRARAEKEIVGRSVIKEDLVISGA